MTDLLKKAREGRVRALEAVEMLGENLFGEAPDIDDDIDLPDAAVIAQTVQTGARYPAYAGT